MISIAGADPAALSMATARETLQFRARSLATIRRYFAERGVMEVETPLLAAHAATDPQLDNFALANPLPSSPLCYLQTSPEYAMKRLLALGSGSIYQLGKAFRRDAPSRLHLPEFTLLEWYRVGFDMPSLMADVAALAEALLGPQPVEYISYREAFILWVGIDPWRSSDEALAAFARQKIDISFSSADRNVWLDLLLSHCLEPRLGRGKLTFLFDYPCSQAALSRIERNDDGEAVARRFELYSEGVELANGYHELTDAAEQRARFEQDNRQRQKMGLESRSIDEDLMAALERGLPDCAGVALGVDRLLALAAGALGAT